MPELQMRRRFTRFPIAFPLRHRVEGHPAMGAEGGWTRDLSGGGACVELAESLRPDVSLRLLVRTDRGTISATSRVIWRGEPPRGGGGIRHGIAFTQLAPDQLETLRSLLLSLRPWRHTRGRVPIDLSITCQVTHPPGPSLRGRVANVSREGLLLRLPVALLPFTDLEVTLPTPLRSITLAGTIAWVEPRDKRKSRTAVQHGLRFTRLDWPTSLALARLLADPV